MQHHSNDMNRKVTSNCKMNRLVPKIHARLLSGVFLGIAFLMMSCSQQQKKDDSQVEAVEEYAATPVYIQSTDSTGSDSVPQNSGVGNVVTTQTVTDAYDDGYLDGEAMAEEDRVAGQPGMQVGMDDDDDDYEDGFDDGYDE